MVEYSFVEETVMMPYTREVAKYFNPYKSLLKSLISKNDTRRKKPYLLDGETSLDKGTEVDGN